MTMTMAALQRARERVPCCAAAAVVDLGDGAVLASTPGRSPGTDAAALAVRDLLRRPSDGAAEPAAEVILAAGAHLLVGLRSLRRPELGLVLVCDAGALLGLALAFARVCLGEIEQET